MLTAPSVEQLYLWKREVMPEPLDEALELSIDDFLRAAADMMEMATGLSTEPQDALGKRVMLRGILDMAWYLGTSHEERDALFSPFSSERIGSYSYSKMQKIASLSGTTGVPFFDLAVAYFDGLASSDHAWSDSERIMPGSLEESRDPLDLSSGESLMPNADRGGVLG